MENKIKKFYITVNELAKMLGISRVAVFKRIKKGQIPAERIGRLYVISKRDADKIIKGNTLKKLTEKQKKDIDKIVKKVVNEYGETLKLLGKE